MHKHANLGHLITAASVGLMLVAFVTQATLVLDQQDQPEFSIEFKNIAYGYHDSSNLCQTHTPNGVQQSPEQCDDGNGSNLDSCTNICKNAVCGDGYVRTETETCDDGNTNNGDGCSSVCAIESGYSCTGTAPSTCSTVCGNGIKTSNEGCDDGNTVSGDGCSSSCTVQTGFSCSGTAPTVCDEICGDTLVVGAEQCDDGNSDNDDACLNTCINAGCGDGYIQAGETCDGNGAGIGGETASCDVDCTAVSCGDMRTNAAAGEQCDDGNDSTTDACLPGCIAATCGDGYLRSGAEQCEPPGVGTCASNCTQQRGVGGTLTTPSVTEEIQRRGPPPHCGNAVLEPDKGEKCDVGRFNGLSPVCDRWCNDTFCGNGIVEAGAEECEPDRQQDGDYVVRTCGGRSCTVPVCDADDVCVGGCMWVFTPKCSVVQLVPAPAGSAGSAASTGIAPVLHLGSAASATSLHAAAGSSFSASAASQASVAATQTSAAASAPSVTIMPISKSAASEARSGASASISPFCGNGRSDAGEDCDNGALNSNTAPDSCRKNCRNPSCGDGVQDAGEQCDDGNDILGDGCTSACTLSTCGNGTLEHGEECDDGPNNTDTLPDSCSTRCLLPRCGDGVTDTSFGEGCDDGEANSNTVADRCRLNCTLPRCGDGVQDTGEQCDDGNASNKDFCTTSCRAVQCGNGTVDWNEACDDGNTANGDGCSNSCLRESSTFLDWLKNSLRLPFANKKS